MKYWTLRLPQRWLRARYVDVALRTLLESVKFCGRTAHLSDWSAERADSAAYWAHSQALKTEVECHFETPVIFFRTKRRCVPENRTSDRNCMLQWRSSTVPETMVTSAQEGITWYWVAKWINMDQNLVKWGASVLAPMNLESLLPDRKFN
jgi:hypothetical protein